MIKLILLASLLFFGSCERTPLVMGIPKSSLTVNGSAEFVVDSGQSLTTLFIKVITTAGEPILTAVAGEEYQECNSQNTMALCVIY